MLGHSVLPPPPNALWFGALFSPCSTAGTSRLTEEEGFDRVPGADNPFLATQPHYPVCPGVGAGASQQLRLSRLGSTSKKLGPICHNLKM